MISFISVCASNTCACLLDQSTIYTGFWGGSEVKISSVFASFILENRHLWRNLRNMKRNRMILATDLRMDSDFSFDQSDM